MAHKQTYVAQRTPGIESKLDSLAQLVKILAVLVAVVYITSNWGAVYGLAWKAGLILDVIVGLLVATIVAAILSLLAEHLRLRRHELGFEHNGLLERDAVSRERCSVCAKPLLDVESRCRACGATFDAVEPPAADEPR